MAIVDARCAICGRMIQIPDDTETCFCMYCGNKMLTEAAVKFANFDKRVEISKKENQTKDFEIRGGVLYKYLGESLNVVIPDTVRKLEDGCFKEMSIESVVIPGTVREWKNRTFEDCKYLKSVEIKDGVTIIGNEAFDKCTSLENVKIPNSLKEIGYRAFAYCSKLTNIKLPDGITNIGMDAFQDCPITVIKFPKSLKIFQDFGLEHVESIVIPDGVEEIHGLITWSDDDDYINYLDCEKIVIPNSVKELKDTNYCFGEDHLNGGTFAYCKNLKEVTLPNKDIPIGPHTFDGCTNLIKINTSRAPWEVGAIDTPWGEIYCKNSNKNPSEIATMAIHTSWGKDYCKEHNLCTHCGGTFKGMFKQICAKCGYPKNY